MSSARGAFRTATHRAWLLIRNVRNASCWTSGVPAHRSVGFQGGFLIVGKKERKKELATAGAVHALACTC
eukprot:202751-Pelagomonas_calceolata.AAC.1